MKDRDKSFDEVAVDRLFCLWSHMNAGGCAKILDQ